MTLGMNVLSQLIRSLYPFFKRWDTPTLISIWSELSMLADRCRHYNLLTIKSCHVNEFSFEVPALVPVSCVMVGGYFLRDVMTLTKTVGINTLVHRKGENGAGS